MADDDTPERLIDQIAKCLRLAKAIGDSKTADILRAMTSDYQMKLDQLQGRDKGSLDTENGR